MRYSKIVLMFPGQGSQYEGMGRELHNKSEVVRNIYSEANDILGYKSPTIEDICFKKRKFSRYLYELNIDEIVSKITKDILRPHLDRAIKKAIRTLFRPILLKTEYTQPALLTTDYACYKALEERCHQENIELKPFAVMGHSLGEYPALVVAGVMDFETALRLVQKRAGYMSEASKPLHGELRAILEPNRKKNLDPHKLKNIANEHNAYIALINSTRNVVVGGPTESLHELSIILRKEGKKIILLDLEGPFHTPGMVAGAENFQEELRKRKNVDYLYQINPAITPLIANVTAGYMSEPEAIKEELHLQIYKPVNFRGSIEKALQEGADLFIEIGPKRFLSGFVKDINPKVRTLNVEDSLSLEETVRELRD